MRKGIATPIIAILILGVYHKIIKTIIIMGLCLYYALNVVLISNDSIYSKWMTRILNNIYLIDGRVGGQSCLYTRLHL